MLGQSTIVHMTQGWCPIHTIEFGYGWDQMLIGTTCKLVVGMFQNMLAGMIGNFVEELGWVCQHQRMWQTTQT